MDPNFHTWALLMGNEFFFDVLHQFKWNMEENKNKKGFEEGWLSRRAFEARSGLSKVAKSVRNWVQVVIVRGGQGKAAVIAILDRGVTVGKLNCSL